VKPVPKHSVSESSRTRRSPRTWAVTAIIAAAAVLIPCVTYATASQASPAAGQSAGSCRGVTEQILPATGFISNSNRSQGGHFWWRAEPDGGVCVGTVVEWVQYNVPTTKTWHVIVYDTQNPKGVSVGSETFTLNPGWYLWPFRVRQEFAGLSAVCVTAGDSFGRSCIHFVE
jgi:hypothetical protein